MEKLNRKETEVYEYLCQTIRRSGYSPTVRDIQEALGIKSTATVHSYLDRLEQKGYISKKSGKSRTIRTSDADLHGTEVPGGSIAIPLVGQVAAGSPILAEENREGTIVFPLNGRNLEADRLYALRIKGESMVEAGIGDGSVVIVEQQAEVSNGQIVVALLGEEATVKTFYREKDHIRLQPENRTMEPIITRDAVILGRVVACIKYF